MDFQGTFDNVEWIAMLNRMREVECDEIPMLASYFKD